MQSSKQLNRPWLKSPDIFRLFLEISQTIPISFSHNYAAIPSWAHGTLLLVPRLDLHLNSRDGSWPPDWSTVATIWKALLIFHKWHGFGPRTHAAFRSAFVKHEVQQDKNCCCNCKLLESWNVNKYEFFSNYITYIHTILFKHAWHAQHIHCPLVF